MELGTVKAGTMPMPQGARGRIGGRHSGDLGPAKVEGTYPLGYEGAVYGNPSGFEAYARTDGYDPTLGYPSFPTGTLIFVYAVFQERHYNTV